jgi:hypothetical protein
MVELVAKTSSKATFAERITRPRYLFAFLLVWSASLIGIVVAGSGAWYGGLVVLFVVVPLWVAVLVLALIACVVLRRAVRYEKRLAGVKGSGNE